MPQNVLPEFKGAIYNTTKAHDTDFFASNLEPTVTPSIFLVYFIRTGSGSNIPKLKRTNGSTTVLEQIFPGTINNDVPYLRQIPVAPGDEINLKTDPDSGNITIKTLIVVEIEFSQGIPIPQYSVSS